MTLRISKQRGRSAPTPTTKLFLAAGMAIGAASPGVALAMGNGGIGGGWGGVPTCNTVVNVENCQTYLTSNGYCESLVKTECQEVISKAHKDARDAITTTREVLPGGDMTADSTVTAKYIADEREDHYINGVDSMFVANNNMDQDLSTAQDGGSRLDVALDNECTRDAASAGNPYRICSCIQYAYDSYYSVRPLEQKVANTAMDFRAVLADARSVMEQTIRSKDGINTDSVSPHQEPRNAFYSIGGWGLPYPPSTTKYSWDRTLRDEYKSTRRVYLFNVDQHMALADALQDIPDEKLNYLFDEQAKFLATLDFRATRYQAYLDARAELPVGSDEAIELANETATELRAIDAQLEAGLRRGKELGCIAADVNDVTPCDWSPKFFYRDLQRFVSGVGEDKYQACVQMTGDYFGNTDASSLANSATFGNYLVAESQSERALGAVTSDIDDSPTVGQQFSDNGQYGNEDFNVKYDYNFAWGLTDYDKTDAAGNRLFCKSNLRGGGTFNVDGAVFGRNRNVVDFDAWGYTKTEKENGQDKDYIYEEVSMKILGNDLFTPRKDRVQAKYSWSKSKSHTLGKDGEGYKMSKTFVVVAVPVTVEGGLTGTFGVDINLDAGLIRDCQGSPDNLDIGVQSQVKPYVDLDAYLSAGIGWSGLSAGVKGEVNLVEAELPFSAEAGIEMQSTNIGADLFLIGKADLDLKLKTLDGKVKVYVEYLIGSSEKEIFSWPGYELESNLFDFDAKYPLIQVAYFPGA